MPIVTPSEARQRWGRALAALDRETSATKPDDVAAWRRREERKIQDLTRRWSGLAEPGVPPLTDAAAAYSRRPAQV